MASRVHLFALSAALVAACNAISGLDDDFVLSDAGTIPGDASSSGSTSGDALADQNVTDGPASDGDGLADVIDSAPLDCTTTQGPSVLLCETFDPPKTTWSTRGAMAPMITSGRSGQGLRARVLPTGSSVSSGYVHRLSASVADGQTVRLRFWFKVGPGASTYAAIGMFELNGREHGLAIYTVNGSNNCPSSAPAPCVDENDQEGRRHDPSNSTSLTADDWHRADVQIRRNGAGVGGRVLVDDRPVDERAFNALPGPFPSLFDIGVGAFYSSETGTTEVTVDDVLVTLEGP